MATYKNHDKTELYKVTNFEGRSGIYTNRPLQWEHGVTHEIELRDRNTPPFQRAILCSRNVIHAYRSPYQAVLFDSKHTGQLPGSRAFFADDRFGILWVAEGKIEVEDRAKVGVYALTTWYTIDPPKIPEDMDLYKVRTEIKSLNDIHDAFGVPRWRFS